MDEREFFDHLYQLWCKTTAAEDGYWKIEHDPDSPYVDVVSVDKDEWENVIGHTMYERDADFITAIHGCFPDLIRRVLAALDDAERRDVEADVAYGRLASAEMRVDELQSEVEALKADLEGLIAG